MTPAAPDATGKNADAESALTGSRATLGGMTAQRVRIYLSEGDTTHHQATYTRILDLLRREGAAGAGVFRGVAGFGASGQLHTASFPDVVQPLPLILEWIDSPERVGHLMPAVCAEAPEALITVEEVRVAQAGHRALRDLPKTTHVRDVMTPAAKVDCAAPETSLHDLAVLLLRERLRAVPVVDTGRRVVGIITNGDLVERGGLPLRLELLGALGDPERPEVAAHLTGLHGQGRTAASIMTQDVVTIAPDALAAEAAKLMLERRLKRLPVVDADGRLLGVLSRMDVLKTATVGYGPGERAAGAPGGAVEPSSDRPDRRGTARLIGDVMKRDVPWIYADTPLPEVLEAIVSTRLNRAVVVDLEHRPLGLVADVDLMQRVTPAAHPGVVQTLMRHVLAGSPEQREEWQRLTGHAARDLMRPLSEMLVVPEDADIAGVIDQSLERRFKLVAVVDAQGRLVGMADRADLLAALVSAS